MQTPHETKADLKVVVAQIGAREHYQIPMMCHASGMLAKLYTDIWVNLPPGIDALLKNSGSAPFRRLLGRSVPSIPSTLVESYPASALWWWWRQRHASGRKALYTAHEQSGKSFAARVTRTLDRIEHSAFFGFSSASLEALEHERCAGRLAVLDVVAPQHLEEEILARERERFPGWERGGEPIPRSFLDRLEAEWETAHRIVVNSDWSKNALVKRGVAAEKVFVVPISYQITREGRPRTKPTGTPLRVLWLGTLRLSKGFPYALEAARRLVGLPVQFTFAGPTDIDMRRVEWPSNSNYIGQIPRTETSNLYENHDLFLLPTLSDGFAITQVEAMAHGLPVISTNCCAGVVEDGISGTKIEAGSTDAIVNAITRFLDGEIDLADCSLNALERAKQYSKATVWEALARVLTP